MAKLTPPNTKTLVKALLIGDPGSGKTGSLISLIRAGYQLRILDMDNKIQTGILPQLVSAEKLDFSNVEFISLRDTLRPSPQGFVPQGTPTAFMAASKLVDKWDDGSQPKDWGSSHVLVLDSLTFLGDAAFAWAQAMSPAAKDPRQWYGTAQDLVEDFIGYITAESFNTNVLVIAHINWAQRQDGTMKGYPMAVGSALGPKILAYFDNYIMAVNEGNGNKAKRSIATIPSAMLDLKNPAAFKMPATLPIETGLATFFENIKS